MITDNSALVCLSLWAIGGLIVAILFGMAFEKEDFDDTFDDKEE